MSSRPVVLPSGTPRDLVVARIAEAFRRNHVRAVLLRAPGLDAGPAGNVRDGEWRHDVDILVRRSDRDAADRAMADLDWRIAIGGLGAWKRIPTVSYHWEYAPNLDVHRGLPCRPMPSIWLRRLESRLFDRAEPTSSGLPSPDAASLAVVAAVQAARPGGYRSQWLDDVRIHADRAGEQEVVRFARSLGLAPAVLWALGAASDGSRRWDAGPLFGGWRGGIWRATVALRRHLRPRRWGAIVSGIPRVGNAIVRSRFAGIELLAGPGAFTPQLVSEPMVEIAIDGLPTDRPAVAVDVGTGVGAVALAVARARPTAEVHGCDLSAAGLRWAERNRRRLGLRNVRFHRGSLLEPLGDGYEGRVDVITANVPYVPPAVFGDAYRDPEAAVLGQGADGLDLQRQMLGQAMGYLAPEGRIILQMASDQWELFAPSMRSWGVEPQPIAASSFEDAICWGVADSGR